MSVFAYTNCNCRVSTQIAIVVCLRAQIAISIQATFDIVFFLRVNRTLLGVYRALLNVYRHLLGVYKALLGEYSSCG